MREWIDVATLVKSKNLKGRFVVRSTAGLPFVLREGLQVAFVPPQTDVPRSAQVVLVANETPTTAEVAFDCVDAKDAEALVGCHCLVRRSFIDQSVLEEPSLMWEGWTVEDVRHGVVGTIVDMIDNFAQSLLEVERHDGKGNVLVPVVDEIIRDVDVEGRTVKTDLPNGLLEL